MLFQSLLLLPRSESFDFKSAPLFIVPFAKYQYELLLFNDGICDIKRQINCTKQIEMQDQDKQCYK